MYLNRSKENTMNLPLEIVNHILDYRQSMIHFEHMKDIVRTLPQHHAKLTNELAQRHIDYIYHLYGYDYVWTIENVEYYMNIFSQCKCCKRHNTNKPTVSMLHEGFVPPYPMSPNVENRDCMCMCRHLSRFLCREINDEIVL